MEFISRLTKNVGFRRPRFNQSQLAAAIGNIIGRMASPGSERQTQQWLQATSGLGELIAHDFDTNQKAI